MNVVHVNNNYNTNFFPIFPYCIFSDIFDLYNWSINIALVNFGTNK